LRAVQRFVLRVAGSLSVVLGAVTAAAQPTEAELSRRISELELDTTHRASLAEPLGKAKKALERARRSSKGGGWAPADKASGRQPGLLRSVAGAWLDVARDLSRTIDAEKAANEAQKKLDDTETKVLRGKALLEETIARRSRIQAQLDALDRPKAEAPSPPTPTAAPAQAPATKPEPKPKPEQGR
jgi:hypothetical protein